MDKAVWIVECADDGVLCYISVHRTKTGAEKAQDTHTRYHTKQGDDLSLTQTCIYPLPLED